MKTQDPDLKGKRVAVLATHGFEQSELLGPVDALQADGAAVEVITPDGEAIRGWDKEDWGQIIAADGKIRDTDPAEFDALLLPGGALNCDKLRTLDDARKFVNHFLDEDKPAFVICHGAQILIDAEQVAGRRMTSYPAISKDLINAGAEWEDSEVVEDGNLITSRHPDDLPAFCGKIREVMALQTD